MTERLRVAVVGCGRMGTQRARAARELGATIVLADPDEEQRERLASEFPPGSVEALGSDPDWEGLDAVFVCTPASARGPVELAAVEARVPVFVEKPIGLSCEHVRPVLDAFEASGVLNHAGYMNRYRPGVLALRDALQRADTFAVHCHWVVGPYLKHWWPDPNRSGGPFNDQATHLIDVCRYIIGDITDVVALERPARDGDGIADVVTVGMRFASGALGSLLYSYRAAEKHVGMSVFSSAGRFTLDGWDLRPVGSDTPPEVTDPGGITPIFRTETRAFLDAVRNGDASGVRCTFADAYGSQLVADAVHRSLATGERVAVSG
jgi:myo-inositol 2-dehydrogenase / D-chiro-inositol 1-dehydrogenase